MIGIHGADQVLDAGEDCLSVGGQRLLVLRHGRASGELDGDMNGADGVCWKVNRCGVCRGRSGWLDGSGVCFGCVDLDLAIRGHKGFVSYKLLYFLL